jgi:hypothetical protein
MAIWFLIAVTLLGTAIPVSLSAIDQLIRREHDLHHKDWERDGRPIGSFFLPPGARLFRSRFAFNHRSFAWLFSTQQWVRGDPIAIALLRRFRWSTFMGQAGFILAFYLMWRLVSAASFS